MNFGSILKAIHNYVIFFLIVSFTVTCCTMLFLSIMAESMGLTFTDDNIGTAAKVTMVNVLLLTFLLSLCDHIRRRLTVERPVRKIVEAGRRLTEGDFSVRIDTAKGFNSHDGFLEIAHCFNKMAEELSSTETLRTDFVANVSHELKTPLAVMQNYGTLLQEPGLSDEKRMEYAHAVADASQRLASLVTNILKLNKLENQQIEPKLEEYDISDQLCQCLLGFEEAWEEKEIHIETDIEDGITVRADREMMSILWNNLFSNAIKFTDRGGTVTLTASSDEDHATVSVKDTGCGITPEVGKHMFDKFYQGDTSRATCGNGLGLALVKRIADITGSDITVDSEVGRGTVFTVKVRRNI